MVEQYPYVRREGPDHVVFWESLRMRFSHLREHSEGYSAWLRVTYYANPDGPAGDIFNSRFQLLGPRSKKDVARDCSQRLPDLDWDWVARVEHACRLVLESLQEGEPIIDLSEGDPPEDMPWLIDNFCRQNENTLVFGQGESGKSLLGLSLAVAMLTPMAAIPAIRPIQVLYLDYEDSEDNIRRRLAQLAAGLGLGERPRVRYKRGEASLPTMEEALGRQIAREGIDYLIVDSAALACGAEPEKADSANAYFRALRNLRLRAGSLTIAHQTKVSENDRYPFGSVFWYNSPRRIWRMRGAHEEGVSELNVGLWNTKNNNGVHDFPLAYQFSFKEGAIYLSKREVGATPDFRVLLSLPKQIKAVIAEYGQSLRRGVPKAELQEEIDELRRSRNFPNFKEDTFDRTVRKMLANHELEEIAGVLWLGSNREIQS